MRCRADDLDVLTARVVDDGGVRGYGGGELFRGGAEGEVVASGGENVVRERDGGCRGGAADERGWGDGGVR